MATATEEKVSLTPEEVGRTTAALEDATKRLAETRQKMETQNAEIGKTLSRLTVLEKQNTDGGTELTSLKQRLENLAASVQGLAEQNSNLVETTRKAMLSIGKSGADSGRAYMWRGEGSKGMIFASRQQAVELGYFCMATMKRDGHAKQYARNWLKERVKDLHYLPNLPQGLVQVFGVEHLKVIDACQRQGFEYGAQALASNVTPGSVLTFPQFADTFIRNVEQYGMFRQNAMVWPMGAETVYIPRRTGGVSVYWVGEAQAGSYTDPSWDLLTMIAKKAMVLHQFSSELAEDENAAISLADLVMFEFSLAWAQEEDRIGLLGNGLGGNGATGYAGFMGVLGCGRQDPSTSEDGNLVLHYDAATNLDRTDEVTLRGLRTVIGMCHTWARANAKWYVHRTVAQDLYGIETTGGGPITSPDAAGHGKTLLGYPVVECEVMPVSPGTASTGVFAFGDLRKSWILGDRRTAEVETSEHYAFNTDQLTLRFSARVAFKPVQANGMVVYVTAA
jgi:HK97 family phage major capsid protein